MSRQRRHHNVFYAYRGQSPGDPIAADRPQLEMSVTKALVVTLEHGGEKAAQSFAEHLLGRPAVSGTFAGDLEVPFRDPAGREVVVLGLSPLGALTSEAFSSPTGGSRVDATLETDQLLVLVEAKVVGGCDPDQLWRHARAFGQDEPVATGEGWLVPGNWVMRSWSDVIGWTDVLLADPDVDPVTRFMLAQLRDYLGLCGFIADEQPRRVRAKADDARDALAALSEALDLRAIRDHAAALYGSPGAVGYVDARGCRTDAARVAAACLASGVDAPPELHDARGEPANVITPRRALSILYGPDAFEATVAVASPVGGARKFLARGIDRCALAAMLAWADTASATFGANARRLVLAAWPTAPWVGPATPELARALIERRLIEVPPLTERFDQAFLLASSHHRLQRRKGTDVPYVSHLLAVTSLVLEMGGTEDEAIGALLHDMVEDGGGPPALAEIRARFGAVVARIVEANSDTDIEPKPPWRARKEAYIAAIAHKQPDELRVSLADKLHNARAILLDYRVHGEALWDRFKAGEGESVRWYYQALHEAFDLRRRDLGDGAAPFLDELGRTLGELERLVSDGRVPSS
jgi:GTP pyrophosphokinase